MRASTMAESIKLNQLTWAVLSELSISDVGSLATTIATFLALCAAAIACVQLYVSKFEARNALVKSIYKDCLRLAFDYPEYSSPSYGRDGAKPNYHEIKSKADKFEKYEFFVSQLLFALEEILIFKPKDTVWRKISRDQMKYHALYLQERIVGTNLEKHYSRQIRELMREAVATYNIEIKFSS
jgi:hypothetical protein